MQREQANGPQARSCRIPNADYRCVARDRPVLAVAAGERGMRVLAVARSEPLLAELATELRAGARSSKRSTRT